MFTSTRSIRIEWCDCDPAGIIFYPRYFEIFDTSTTVLIERALGMTKIDYLKAYDFAGHPVVETRAIFRAPSRFAKAMGSCSLPPCRRYISPSEAGMRRDFMAARVQIRKSALVCSSPKKSIAACEAPSRR